MHFPEICVCKFSQKILRLDENLHNLRLHSTDKIEQILVSQKPSSRSPVIFEVECTVDQ